MRGEATVGKTEALPGLGPTKKVRGLVADRLRATLLGWS